MANITVKNFGIKKYQLSLLFFSFLFFIAIFSASYIQESNRNDLLRIDNIQTRAESGEAQAQYELALRYHSGKNYLKAHEWYLKAAEQGHAEAQNNLGTLYSSGLGVTQDYPKAIDWMRKAADAGNANAQANMGVMYLRGRGVEKSDTEAFKWFLMAAEQGQAQAEAEMGRAYHLGLGGFPVDDKQSFKWYKRAAEKGDGTAQNNLAHLYVAGNGIEKDYFEAGRWLLAASQNGIPQAQKYLADTDKHCNQDNSLEQPQANACMVTAYMGNPKTQYTVGTFFHSGNFVKKDTKKAAEWYLEAAKQGHPLAQSILATLFYNGDGVPKDYVEAYAWMAIAANCKGINCPEIEMVRRLKEAYQLVLKKHHQEEEGEDKADEYRRLYLRD